MEFLNRSQTRLICFIPFEEGAESIWDHDIEVIHTEFRYGVQCSFFCCCIGFIEKWSVTDRSSLFRMNKIISALYEKGNNFSWANFNFVYFLLKNLYIFFSKETLQIFYFNLHTSVTANKIANYCAFCTNKK